MAAKCKRCGLEKPSEAFRPQQARGSNLRLVCRRCEGLTEVAKFKQPTKESLKPTRHPTMLDIAWAAGIYEGEGSCCPVSTQRRVPTFRISVCQKDPEILHRLRSLFGGSLHRQRNKPNNVFPHPNEITSWYLYGDRSRGFALTVFSFLSTRRRAQIKKAWEVCHPSK